MTTLEIITRCYKRPTMLAVNQASLARQTCDDWTQTLLVDDVGMGVVAANARLADFTPTGRYVWALDDDDHCVYDMLVEDVRTIADRHDPDVIFVRFDHGPFGVLPYPGLWRSRPLCGNIGGSGVIVRRDVWMAQRVHWTTGRYETDFDFVEAVYNHAKCVYWHDVIAGQVQRISRGAVE